MAGKIELVAPLDGVVTIQPEDTASNFTVTIPAGTSDLVSNATLRTELNATGSAPIFACRAWVNFDGTTTTPTIRASGNVSSVTENGTGDYTVNFTTAMPDANYSVSALARRVSGVGTSVVEFAAAPLSTETRISTRRSNDASALIVPEVTIAVFR